MKPAMLVLAVALAAVAAAAADDGLADLDKAWMKAMLAGDAAAVAALYAPDAIMFPPDAMEAKGRDAIQKTYEDLLAGMRILDVKITPAKTHGHTAIGWVHWSLQMAPKVGGDPVSMEGRFTEVAKRIGGKWLYVNDHASAPLLPPAAKK